MSVNIGGIPVGDGHPCFVVAEIGINHNGSLDITRRLIDTAVEAGCQAVKFQKRLVPVVYSPEELAAKREFDPSFIDHALARMREEDVREPIFSDAALARLMLNPTDTINGDLKHALEFGIKEFDTIDLYCRERRILWFGSAWDGLSAHILCGFRRFAAHKIASACLTHRNLLQRIHDDEKPIILSTGGSTMEQIETAADVLGHENLVILHCTSTYPCPDEEVNLAVIETLRQHFPSVPVGYSAHSPEPWPAVTAAAGYGAAVVEVHITLDRAMPGSDQKASLEPSELTNLVSCIRRIEEGVCTLDRIVPREKQAVYRGSPEKRVLPSEVPVMRKLRRVADF